MPSRAYTVHWIPTCDGRRGHAIVFRPSTDKRWPKRLWLLHLDIYGEAFIGGIAEFDAPWCQMVTNRTGAAIVSPQHRDAPTHPFPTAIDDIDDVVPFLQKHGEDKLELTRL